jgi:D-glycero-D-manno-heptose 1,7-bisphosphate phosphatase
VLVLNGDSYCDVNLAAFLAWHRARRAQGSLVLTHVQETGRYGRVQVDAEGAVVSFIEKAQALPGAAATPGWINAGIYLVSRKLLDSIPAIGSVSLERESFPTWVGGGLYGYQGGGRFLDIGTPEAFEAAQTFFAAHYQRSPAEHQQEESGGAPTASGPRVVLLDRDGTINVERHYLSEPDDVALLPGVADGLRQLRDLGLQLVVVTNQSAIARGYFDTTRLAAIHTRLQDLLAQSDVHLGGIYICPHRPEDGCPCRKPEPGLVMQAMAELHFDPRSAFIVGDKGSDIALGHRVGATTFLVTTGYGQEALADPTVHPDFVVDSLAEAAEVIAHLLVKARG